MPVTATSTLVVWLLSAAPAAPAPTQPPPAAETSTPASFDCAAGRWVLDGAPAKVDAGDGASFNPDWLPTLTGIAGCTKSPAWRTACLSIRGHTDKVAFNDPVVTAFGSVEAAQLARGRGRSLSVLNRLYQLGVDPSRLRELPPAVEPDYRGVEVAAVLGCTSDPSQAPALSAADLRTAVRDSVHDELEERRAAEERAKPPPPPVLRHFWAEANLEGSMVGTSPESVFGPLLQLGGGWRYRHVFARADVGATVGSALAARVGWEFGGAVGYYHAPWLQLGLTASDRFSSSSLSNGWLEQTWSVGVEGTHCLWRFGQYDVCARESLLPIGGRTRRGEEVGGQLFRIPDTSNSALRFELGASVRREF